MAVCCAGLWICLTSVKFAVEVKRPGGTLAGNVPTLGVFLREVMRENMQNFRVFGPDQTQSNRLEVLYEVAKKVWAGRLFSGGRRWRRAGLTRPGHGDAQRAHGGRMKKPAGRPARFDRRL